VVAAAIGGGDGFDLHRCRGVEHEVHDLPAYSFPKYGGSLAHEFNNSFLAVGVEAGTSCSERRACRPGRRAQNPPTCRLPPRVHARSDMDWKRAVGDRLKVGLKVRAVKVA
jgi:hypothetical protein